MPYHIEQHVEYMKKG